MAIKLEISESLTSYQEDIEKELKLIELEIKNIQISLNAISKSQSEKIEKLFKSCENNIRQMEIEISLLTKNSKDKFGNILNSFKDKLKKLSKTYSELSLIRKNSSKEEKNSKNEVNTKLLKTAKNLDEGTNMMAETIRTLVNVNTTDKETMASLKKQTDIIKNTSSKLSDAEGYYQRADAILRNMIRRVFTNKLVLFALVILLGLINGFLIYIKLKYSVLGFKKI